MIKPCALLQINPSPFDVMSNGKKMISVNMKSPEGLDVVKKLCLKADVLLDTFRPGVLEKLGLGPEILMKENKGLIYARLSGYGQDGYYKDKGGHDINYVAISGLLSLLKRNKETPFPSLNILADFAGGSFSCVIGILLALLEKSKSGNGQVIDVSLTEGVSYLGSWLFKSRELPIWIGEPGTNVLDGGMPFYNTYETKDGKYMAVGALEPQFYSEFIKGLEIDENEYSQMGDIEKNREKFTELFLSKTQKEWSEIFDKLDACVTPVLDLTTAYLHESNKSRNSFLINKDNIPVPQPSPKLSHTPGISVEMQSLPQAGEHTLEVLQELGYTSNYIQQLIKNKHVVAKESKSKL